MHKASLQTLRGEYGDSLAVHAYLSMPCLRMDDIRVIDGHIKLHCVDWFVMDIMC